jgi:hypothetical protein
MSTTNKDKKLYSKFLVYLRARSFNRQLQLLVNLRVNEVFILYVFLTTTITR